MKTSRSADFKNIDVMMCTLSPDWRFAFLWGHLPKMSTVNHNISFWATRNFIGSRIFFKKKYWSVGENAWALALLVDGYCLLVCALLRLCLFMFFLLNVEKIFLLGVFFCSCVFCCVFHLVRGKLVLSIFNAFFAVKKSAC